MERACPVDAVPRWPEFTRANGDRVTEGGRGVLSSTQPIDNDLYDAAVSSPFERLLKSATLPFSEHLSLLVRDWRRRLLRFEDHGLKDGPVRSVSKGFSRFYENRVKCRKEAPNI